MSAGKWEYVGVSRNSEPAYSDAPTFDVEARHPYGKTGRVYVRLQLTVGWDVDHPEDLYTLRMVVDGVDPTDNAGHVVLPARADFLRTIPYRKLLSQAATELTARNSESPTIEKLQRVTEVPDLKALRSEWPKGDVQTVVKWVGYVYTTAVADGNAPTTAVSHEFGVSRATAQRMVAAAREGGFIAEHVVGGPGSRQGKNEHDKGKP